MAIQTLSVSSIVSNSGWTSPLNAQQSDDVYANTATAGSVFTAEIDNVPGDFGDANTIQLGVEWRFATTASRRKSMLLELVDGTGTVINAADGTTPISYTTAEFNDLVADTVHESATFDVSHLSAAQLDAARLRITIR